MPVRFILGRAGSGKTHYCVERITAMLRADPLGPPIYWLLPRQATFQAERKLTCRLGAFTRVRVVSFDGLGRDILTACGDVGIPQVTAVGRQMVVGQLLRTHQQNLKFYTASARRPGLAAEIDATFGEFERAGLNAAALDELLHTLDLQNDPAVNLHDKLHDVSLLLNEYNKYIGQDRLDPQRRLELVLSRVAECELLKEAVLFVDDFYDFTGYEQKLLIAVASVCPRTEIALLVDPGSPVVRDPHALPDDLSVFHRTERTYRSLYSALTEKSIPIQPPLLLLKPQRFTSPSLSMLERNLFVGATPASPSSPVDTKGDAGVPPTDQIQFLETPDARTEVAAAARVIRLALRNGLRLRDIAVLVRDINDYQELIAASFAEHDLPYFADHRRSATHHALLQFIRAALLIARNTWPHEAVMTLLKSGLAGVSDHDADELENYALRHRIRGKMWASNNPWGFRRQLIGGEEDALIPIGLVTTSPIDDARSAVVSKLQPFLDAVGKSKSLTTGEIITQIFALMERFQIRSTLAKWMRDAESGGDLEQRGEHEQVWLELVQLFERMNELLGSEPITLSDFLDALEAGLESFDLALAPPTVDQILVGQIDRTRTPEVKLTIVLGLNEAQFPHQHHENCVLSDSERRSLRKRKIDLDPETERRLLDERFLAYLAFTRSSQRLIVSRHLADEKGRPRNASPFWNELRRLFTDVKIEHIQRASQSDPKSIGTPRQLVTALMRWVRAGAIVGATPASPSSSTGAPGDAGVAPTWAALYQWLATHDCSDDSIDTMRFRSWNALSYTNSASLSPETAAKLFPSPLQATAARLESFAACPFQHFVRHGLHLQQRDDPDITSIDLSNAYHRILENILADVLQTRKDWCTLDPQAMKEMIHVHSAEIGRTLRGELMLSTARNRYILDRIERILAQAIAAQQEINRRGKYRPAFASLKFGGKSGAKLPAHKIATSSGQEVHLQGQIDRVDLHANGRAFTVADYKLATGPLLLDRVYYGLSLQLLTYLLVVQNAGEQLTGRKLAPAAAFFMQLLRSPQTVDHPSEALAPDHPDFHLRIKPRGIIESRAVTSLDTHIDAGNSAVLACFVKQDGQLGKQNVSDIAEQAEFTALLKRVEKRVGELADGIVAGEIGISPYWINRQTPCSRCNYRSVCRFEPGISKYNILPAMKRADVLVKLTGVS